MPPTPPSLYNLKKTTIAFALASIVLLAGLLAMVLQDSTREWKGWQRKFMEYNLEKTEGQLHEAGKKVDQKKLEALKEQLQESEKTVAAHQGEIRAIQTQIAKTDVELTKAKARYQQLKQEQESDRYFFEEHQAHGDARKAAHFKKRIDRRAPELEKAKLAQESPEAQQEAKEKELLSFNEASQKIRKEAARQTQEITLLENKIKSYSPDFAKAILNAPMLDFIHPTLQIQQIVVEHLYDDFYFNKAQKVDRCITCHLGIDQKPNADAPQPFKAHPRLDLFLSSESPHPMEKFGCTVCHGGSGHSAGFTTAAHTPQNEEQAKAWEKKYHWHSMKHWADKMLPLNHVEASCTKCHSGAVEVPKAEKLNEGIRLAQTSGCFGCHKVEGFQNRWKVGPGLGHVQSKLEPDWMVRWLQNPREFRPSTRMPRFFHLSNTSDSESKEKDNAVIAEIASYLMKNSEPVALTSPPLQGDVQTGERLVKEIGCAGCHTVAGQSANHYGPELTGLGSKVKPEWLFTWLKDPKHYDAQSRMPNLRLSDEEAAHITAYLLAGRNEKFESLQLPLVKPETVESLAVDYMKGSMRTEEAKQEVQKMSPEEQLEFVGKKAIGRQGCFACHDIKGFEDAKPIGAELSEEGSKDVEKFYFGFVHIPHTRQDWLSQKVKDPRVFDQGKDIPYLDRLRMPMFGFTDKEAESLTTFLLSLQKSVIPEDMKKHLNMREEKIEAGRLLTAKLNCNGCHTLDGKEGAARSLFEDLGNAPPVIDGEGAKVQPEWLYQFLHSPSAIRPWLKYRMPTFGFKPEELTTMVEYFHALADVPPSFDGGKIPPPAAEELAAGKKLFQMLQCIKCHKSDPEPGMSASFRAPDLAAAKDRLRPQWVIDWLKDPQALEPGTMMPTFFADGQTPVQDVLGGDAGRQIQALRDYLWQLMPDEAAGMTQAGKAA